MLEHKRPTTPSEYWGDGVRAVCVSNQILLPSPSAQTIPPLKTASSLLDFLISCHKGQEVEPWTVFNITPEEVQTVWSMLERHKSLYDYVLGKLRFDWSPHTSRFTVRMPTSTHDIFTELLVQEIASQLKSVARGDADIAAVLDLVRSESTSDVYLYGYEAIDDQHPKHTPDASFAHADSQYPSIVIETSYSQRQKELTRLADEYISGSDGSIAMILGLDIEYGVESKKASLSIWRPWLVPDPEKEEGVLLETFSVREADVFRADDGTTIPGQGLSLQLRDFAPKSCFANIPQQTQSTTVVRITCGQLCSFLHDAETRHDIKRAQRGVQSGLPSNCRKRYGQVTPPEALSPGKEAKFAKCEEKEAARSEARDPVWG